jgi:DNA-binding NarL/FixJ family response regulator
MKSTISPILKIGVAENQNLFRQALCSLLLGLGYFDIVLESDTSNEFAVKLNKVIIPPDIYIVGLGILPQSEWHALSSIRTKWPNVRILILTQLQPKDIIQDLSASRVNGVLQLNCSKDELNIALLKISQSGSYFNSDIVSNIFSSSSKRSIVITKNQIEFLKYCCEDLTYGEIASKMNVSIRTIDGYRDCLFRKLQIYTRQGLMRYAIKRGIVTAATLSD